MAFNTVLPFMVGLLRNRSAEVTSATGFVEDCLLYLLFELGCRSNGCNLLFVLSPPPDATLSTNCTEL